MSAFMKKSAAILLGVMAVGATSGCESTRQWVGTRVCPTTAPVEPGGNQRFEICDGAVADRFIQWSTPGPGFMIQGRYHAPLVVTTPTRVSVIATPERSSGIPPGKATVLLSVGSVPGVDSCAGPAQGHLPAHDEYVQVDELPTAIHTVAPEYPDSARQHGIEGQVLVAALVCASGTIIDAYMAQSIPELDEAAEHAVRQWIFQPAMTGGLPIAVWVMIPVRFTLHGASAPQAIVASPRTRCVTPRRARSRRRSSSTTP